MRPSTGSKSPSAHTGLPVALWNVDVVCRTTTIGLRRKVPEFLADLSIGLFKDLQHSSPCSLVGFPVEFHGKVRAVPAGRVEFRNFSVRRTLAVTVRR